MDTFENESILLTEKLRNEDPDQFHTLVRMHLSFVLDLNTDECENNSEKKSRMLKWNLLFTKKQKGGSKNISEGNFLTADFIAQIQPVIEFLSKEENISQEGIFRRSGKVTRQQELKLLLHQGAEINFNNGQYSVHDCASVLKNLLSELPESVLTDAHYPAYCQIAELYQGKNPAIEERLLRSLQLLILLLPSENRKFFRDIIELLHLAVNHEDKNRMSADNLATLFTPHLLCPRRLSPEAFHINSQIMSHVVAFMIQKGSILFQVPPTVATDVRAYWKKKERKKLSPLKQMNESICDGTAANTVFTFVDRERTAQENQTNPTETALAQLYAYIQSLPESSKKRKLIKQFNKENGYGTPLRANGGKKRTRTLNLGDSIKKHLSGFSKTNKRNQQESFWGDYEESVSQEAEPVLNSANKICGPKKQKENIQTLKQASQNKPQPHQIIKEKNPYLENFPVKCSSSDESVKESFKASGIHEKYKHCETKSHRTELLKTTEVSYNPKEFTSQEQLLSEQVVHFTKKRSSSSPKIPRKKSPREISEFSTTNDENSPSCETKEHQKWPVSNLNLKKDPLFEKKRSLSGDACLLTQTLYSNSDKIQIPKEKSFVHNLNETPKNFSDRYCEELSDFPLSNLLKTPVQKFNASNFPRSNNNEFFLTSSNNTNRLPISYGSKPSFLMTTSTPAPGNGCLLTPIVDKNNSMSPITKSTKRMPKAMQETMMTPRSRKPVISLSGTDLCNLANTDSLGSKHSLSPKSKVPGTMEKLIMENSNEDNVNDDSISSTFRNYLFSRSVLTASPVDLSFSSRADDFLSISEKNSSEENDNYKIFPEILNEAGLSESLLYCLDGNKPDIDSEENDSQAKLDSCSYSSFSDQSEHHIYETAL